MSQIVKTEAIVLSKTDFSDTSKIATFYSKEYGKISGIIKGGRGSNSKTGRAIDPLNKVKIVLYKKDSRDVQTITQTEIIDYYPTIRSDYSSLIHSFAALELTLKLTHEHEINHTLYRGLARILELTEKQSELPEVLLGRFFVFILKEIGYELNIETCSVCGKKTDMGDFLGFDLLTGIICSDCFMNEPDTKKTFTPELLEYILSLKKGMKLEHNRTTFFNKLFTFLMNYTKAHVETFNGLNSLILSKEE